MVLMVKKVSRDRYFIQKLLYTSKDVEWKNQFFQMQSRNEEQDICKESDNKCNEQLEYNTAVDKILKAGESFDEGPIHLFPILRTNMIVCFYFCFCGCCINWSIFHVPNSGHRFSVKSWIPKDYLFSPVFSG